MKKRLFMIWVALAAIATSTQAQVAINATNFPDENFRNWLLNAENISGYGADGVLTDAEIEDIKEMWMTDQGIKDITGIEHFWNLRELALDNNPITNVDIVSTLEQLELLWIGFLNLPTIDLSHNVKLKSIGFTGNQFTNLDLSALTDLEVALLGENQLTFLDFRPNKKLRQLTVNKNPLQKVYLEENTELKMLTVGENQLQELSLDRNTKLESLTLRNSELTSIKLNHNNELKSVRVEGGELLSLDLREKKKLENVWINKGKMESIDASGCTALEYLRTMETPIAQLNVSGCTPLKELECSNGQLKSLNVSGLTALKYLNVSGNQLTTLNIAGCTGLRAMRLNLNKINARVMGTIVANLPELEYGTNWIIVVETTNPAEQNVITKAQVAEARAKGWDMLDYNPADGTAVPYAGVEVAPEPTGLAIDETNFPDENFRNWLLNAENISGFGSDALLTDDEIASIKEIGFMAQGVKDLTGIGYFTALEKLGCYSNLLTTLDLSKNTALQELECSSNQLTSIDVTQCPDLTLLFCDKNELTSIDVTHNPKLKWILCGRNHLTSLDISKNPVLIQVSCPENQLTSLDVSHNPELVAVSIYKNQIRGAAMDVLVNGLPTGTRVEQFQVYKDEAPDGNVMTIEQVAAAKAKGWTPTYYDSSDNTWKPYEGVAAGIAINAENFPDENFRNVLLAREYGADAMLTDEEIAGIKEIDVADNEIKDLTGIGYFTALQTLYCDNNQLTKLDLSNNPELTWLNCQYNQLTTLDLSKTPNLGTLMIAANPLTSIDLSVVPYLSQFVCGSQDVSVIDFSKNERMRLLYCTNADLTHLDVTMFPRLEYLVCSGLKLTSLDLSKNPKLFHVDCAKNQLTTLDLSNNPAITEVYCSTNCISGANMDALVSSLPTVSMGELRVYNNEYNNEANEMTTVQVAAAKAKGWDPTYLDVTDYTWKPYEGVVDGIEGVKIDAAGSGSWYTLDGRKLQGKPARKGVYILNGQKTVLK